VKTLREAENEFLQKKTETFCDEDIEMDVE